MGGPRDSGHYVSPSDRGGDMLLYLNPVHSLFYLISIFCRAGGQTRDIYSILGYCWPTVYDANPTLAQY